MSIVMSFVGMLVLIAIAVLCGRHRRHIKLRTVIGAFLIQFCLGAIILYVPLGQKVLLAISNGVEHVISYGNQGVDFLFGGLVSSKMFDVFGDGGFVFALRVLPMIVFFSALIAVLYHFKIMQIFITVIGGGLRKALGTSRAESLSAAANVFVGQTEAPLVVKPFIKNMTESELFAIMCGGLASIAGSVLAGYAQMGVPMPYLIAGSFMAAPGGLLFAKLMIPETEKPASNEMMVSSFANDDEDAPANVIDAAASGASTGMKIAMNVGAMLLAFVALIALVNGILGGLGHVVGWQGLTLDKIFGWVFAPITWLIGVSSNDIHTAAQFIGQKIAINEFYAYSQYTEFLKHAGTGALTEKSKAIISFALCGFANFSSIAILVGGLAIMAPNRRGDVARLGWRALLAGTLSNLMSATIAGLFIGLGGATGLGIQ